MQSSPSSFNTQRQQAKSLLLKGCYRMACNRYTSLLTSLPNSLPARQTSILYLNLGISLQFQDKLPEALVNINKCIQIDPTYQKGHFRKAQVLMSLNRFEQILRIPPMNREIAAIISEARSKYAEELVKRQWTDIEANMQLAVKSGKWEVIDEVHRRLYEKYSEETLGKFQKQLQVGVFKKYVVCLMAIQNGEVVVENVRRAVGKFVELVYRLFVTRKQNEEVQISVEFWKDIVGLQVWKYQNLNVQLVKLVSFCPILYIQNNNVLLQYFNKHISQILKDKTCADSLMIMLSYNIKLLSEVRPQQKISENFEQLQNSIIKELENYLNNNEWRHLELIQTILYYLGQITKIGEKIMERKKEGYYSGFDRWLGLKEKVSAWKQQSKTDEDPNPSLINEILQTIKSTELSIANLTIIHSAIDLLPNLLPLKQSQQHPSTTTHLALSLTPLQISPKYFLLCCLLCKLTFPADQSPNLLLPPITSHLPANPNIAFRQLELTCILNLTSKQILSKQLENPNTTITLIQKVYQLSEEQSIESVKLKLKLIQFMYFLYVDNDEETNRRHAERMGVEVEKIRAARIMQGEVRKDELEKVDRLREKFVGGSERVITILEGLAKEYETAPIDSNTRLKSIITNLSKAFPNRFFSSPFLTLFLSTHLSEPYPVTQHLTYSFLSTILKRIPNPQLLLYKHQRPICLLLLQSLTKANHELVIFQSLLSLVHMSTLPSQVLADLDIKPILKQLWQQNEYIIHAALQSLNNFLLKGASFYSQTGEKDWEVIGSLLKYYRELPATEKPTTDYSHPQKIYVALVSLFMVGEDYREVEVREMRDFGFIVSQVKKLNQSQKLQMMAKAIHYYNIKGTLDRKVLMRECAGELEVMRRVQPEMYGGLVRVLGPL